MPASVSQGRIRGGFSDDKLPRRVRRADLVSRNAEFEIGVVFAGAFPFLALPVCAIRSWFLGMAGGRGSGGGGDG
jgi:hypothetical protein